jgi:hypothetical protein
VTDLVGKSKEGDTVQVSFTVQAGMQPQRYTLVSYTAPGKTFDPATAAQQKIFQIDTGVFGPGSYTLDVRIPHSYYQVDFVIGAALEPFGPPDSNIFYSAQNRLLGYDNNGTKAMTASPGTLTGFVYHDANNNGTFDTGERPIPGASITLSGKDSKKKSISQTVVTDPAGNYLFTNLPSGTYTISETQPAGYTDGAETLGTAGGKKESDKFSSIKLTAGASGTNYNFGEKQAIASAVTGNQTGTVSFWNSASGQNLIKSLNGSQNSKKLGDWLAATLGNLFGSAAGSSNSLAGKTNAQVASRLKTLVSYSDRQTEVATLALALNVYVTTSGLGGNTAQGYGFEVSSNGLGAALVNVDSSGAALGLDNGHFVTVSELLLRLNLRSRKGRVLDVNGNGSLDTAESILRSQLTSLIDLLNNS